VAYRIKATQEAKSGGEAEPEPVGGVVGLETRQAQGIIADTGPHRQQVGPEDEGEGRIGQGTGAGLSHAPLGQNQPPADEQT